MVWVSLCLTRKNLNWYFEITDIVSVHALIQSWLLLFKARTLKNILKMKRTLQEKQIFFPQTERPQMITTTFDLNYIKCPCKLRACKQHCETKPPVVCYIVVLLQSLYLLSFLTTTQTGKWLLSKKKMISEHTFTVYQFSTNKFSHDWKRIDRGRNGRGIFCQKMNELN